MSYTEKIDVLDMLIEMLMNHEKRLDEPVARLDERIAGHIPGPHALGPP